jgi:hypothetical protein
MKKIMWIPKVCFVENEEAVIQKMNAEDDEEVAMAKAEKQFDLLPNAEWFGVERVEVIL